jgi:transketolase
MTIDGHDEEAIDDAYIRMKADKNGKPKVIVANSIKGKGVSFMEDDNIWHYTRLTEETYAAAIDELDKNERKTA